MRNRNGEPVLTARYLGLVLGTSRLDEFKNYVEKIKYDRVKVVRKLKTIPTFVILKNINSLIVKEIINKISLKKILRIND